MGNSSLFGIGISGLQVAQRGLATTGHNIANVNTEGYTRQRIEVITRPSQRTSQGSFGAGAQIATVTRAFDRFLTDQVRVSTTATAEVAKFQEFAIQLDNLVANTTTGLNPAVDAFFGSLHTLSDDPSSVAARQVVLGQAATLASRFHSMEDRITDMRRSVNDTLRGVVDEINAFTAEIGRLNERISLAEGATGHPANDLRDQRDEMIRQLSARVEVNVFEDNDGNANVTIGGGQALVVGTTVSELGLINNEYDPTQLEVSYTIGTTTLALSDLITGGELRGVLDFRERVLNPAQDALGRVATGIASALNTQHHLGIDLRGTPGGDLFTDLAGTSPTVLPSNANTGAGVVDAIITDVGQVDAGEYLLERTGASHTLTRLSDNKVFNLSTFPGGEETVDGMTLSLGSGAIADGDSFLVRPVRSGAKDFNVAISNVNQIAAAAPMLASAALSNQGNAQVDAGSVNSPDNELVITFTSGTTFDVTDVTSGAKLATGLSFSSGAAIDFNGLTFDITGVPANGDVFSVDNTVTSAGAGNTGSGVISTASVNAPDPNIAGPVTITFDNPPTTFTVTGAATGTPVVNVTYTSGNAISFNGWTIEISGTPVAGDVFSIDPNLNGVGDNRNSLALATLQSVETLDGGTSTFGEAYGQLVSQVGTSTQQAAINFSAQSTLLALAVEERDTVSAVNLDEEAANLLKLQQSFDANARLIAIADEIFGSLLAATGG